jgi:chemotaxis-related protein WspB
MTGAATFGAGTMAREAMHVVARVGDERLAFRVADVEEAIDTPSLIAAPNAPEGLVGQFVHRERTLSAFDAARAFGIPGATRRGTVLVLRVADQRVGLVVDDVEELTALDADRVRPAPAGANASGLLHGVCLPRAGARADAQGSLICLVNAPAVVAAVTARAAADRAGA